MALRYEHLEAVEKHAGKLAALIAIMIALGGLAEITPIFVTAHAVQSGGGVRPYDRVAARRQGHLRSRSVLPVSFADDPHAQIRGTALRCRTRPPPNPSTTARSNGDRSAPGPTSRASAASTPTSGSGSTCSSLAISCPSRTCPTTRGWRNANVDGRDIEARMRVLRLLGDPYSDADIDRRARCRGRQDRTRRTRRVSAGARHDEPGAVTSPAAVDAAAGTGGATMNAALGTRRRRRHDRDACSCSSRSGSGPGGRVIARRFDELARIPMLDAGVSASGDETASMNDFWTGWVLVLLVAEPRRRLFLFVWGQRVDIPVQPDGTTGHVWAHGVLREAVRTLPTWWVVVSAGLLRLGRRVPGAVPGARRTSLVFSRWTSADKFEREHAVECAKLDATFARMRVVSIEDLAKDPASAGDRARGIRGQLRGLSWTRRARQDRRRRTEPGRRQLPVRQ